MPNNIVRHGQLKKEVEKSTFLRIMEHII